MQHDASAHSSLSKCACPSRKESHTFFFFTTSESPIPPLTTSLPSTSLKLLKGLNCCHKINRRCTLSTHNHCLFSLHVVSFMRVGVVVRGDFGNRYPQHSSLLVVTLTCVLLLPSPRSLLIEHIIEKNASSNKNNYGQEKLLFFSVPPTWQKEIVPFPRKVA